MEVPAADRELTTTRRIPAPRAKVWTAFTDPQVLATWWGPNGFTTTIHLWEPGPGGLWTCTMHGPNGKAYPNESRFAEWQAPERWVIDHTSLPHFRLAATLTERGGETEVHWRQTFASAEVCANVRAICVPANEQNLQRLATAVTQFT